MAIRRIVFVLLFAILTTVAFGCRRDHGSGSASGSASASAADEASAPLELVRLDDVPDPLRVLDRDKLPAGEGFSLLDENAPIGPGTTGSRRYARVIPKSGESERAAAARLKDWLSSRIKLPPDHGLVFGRVYEEGDAKHAVGIRTYVATGAVIATRADVQAAAVVSKKGEPPVVGVTLRPDGATRLEDATDAWLGRRLGIVVDGLVESAPVVRAKIAGGHLSITMGHGEPGDLQTTAERLAKRLQP